MSAKEGIERLKETFLRTFDFERKVEIVDRLGELGDEAYDTLSEIQKCTRSCWLRYRILEKKLAIVMRRK